MPFYDYFCENNEKTVEVFHSSQKKINTWGELCRLAKVDPGVTDDDAPVVKLISNVTPTIYKLKGLDKDEPRGKLEV